MPEPQPPTRVLVVDDESQICSLVRDVVQPLGYEIETSQDGRDVLERYQPGEYSLLILDTLLVHASGLELVTKLRDRDDPVPIILMFNPRGQVDRVETFAFTYRVDLLRKPFGVGELRSAVARALRDSRLD